MYLGYTVKAGAQFCNASVEKCHHASNNYSGKAAAIVPRNNNCCRMVPTDRVVVNCSKNAQGYFVRYIDRGPIDTTDSKCRQSSCHGFCGGIFGNATLDSPPGRKSCFFILCPLHVPSPRQQYQCSMVEQQHMMSRTVVVISCCVDKGRDLVEAKACLSTRNACSPQITDRSTNQPVSGKRVSLQFRN